LGAEKTVLGADTQYGKRADMVKTLAAQFLERGDYKTMEEATAAAEREADRLIGNIDKAVPGSGGVRGAAPPAGTDGYPKISPELQRERILARGRELGELSYCDQYWHDRAQKVFDQHPAQEKEIIECLK
jgi:hypothetical protein